LPNIRFAPSFKWLGERLEQLRGRTLVTTTKRNGNGEFTVVSQFYFRGQRDIAVLGCLKFPIHFEVVHQVLPTIAEADVADRSPRETAAARHEQVSVLPLRVKEFVIADLRTPSGVAGTTAGQVWR